MPWWGVLLIVVGAQAVFLLVWWLINRRSADVDELLRQLAKSASKRIDDEVAAEKKAKEEIAAAYRSLAKERKELEEWYNENKAKIDEDARREFENLASDPGAVDRKLDELLGPDDPTPVAASTPDEG